MPDKSEKAPVIPIDISDGDVYHAMSEISGYLDITPADFKEVYLRAYHHAVLRLTRSTRAADVMNREVVSVHEKTPLGEVAEVMATHGISGVPVLKADGTVSGIISEKDFLTLMASRRVTNFMAVVAECFRGRGCLAVPAHSGVASDIMSSPAVTVTEQTLLLEIIHILNVRGINRVPVVDESNKLRGIISRADVMRYSV